MALKAPQQKGDCSRAQLLQAEDAPALVRRESVLGSFRRSFLADCVLSVLHWFPWLEQFQMSKQMMDIETKVYTSPKKDEETKYLGKFPGPAEPPAVVLEVRPAGHHRAGQRELDAGEAEALAQASPGGGRPGDLITYHVMSQLSVVRCNTLLASTAYVSIMQDD